MPIPARFRRLYALAIGAAVLAGCSSLHLTQGGGKNPAARTFQEAPAVGFEPVARGVYIAIDRRQPLTAEGRVRATMTRAQAASAVATAVKPAGTTGQTPGDAAAEGSQKKSDSEVHADEPPQAVKYYLEGRQRFLEGANTDAMVFLEQALQLDPHSFTVLRLMGRVSFAASQLGRGVNYLERARQIRPTDVEVNYLLGRYWLERNDYNRAAYYMFQAEDSPEKQITSTQTPLSSFYLAMALQQGGYHFAAAKEFENFIAICQEPIAGYRYDSELNYLITMEWATQLATAENYARAGAYAEALPHYDAAASDKPEDAFIATRLIESLVYNGKREPARQAALALIGTTQGSEDAIKLLDWTYRAIGRDSDLVTDLAAYLKTNGSKDGQEESTAIALSATLEYLGKNKDAFQTLAAFLANHPDNMRVLQRLIAHVDSADTFLAALQCAAHAIEKKPALHDDIRHMLMPVANGPAGAAYVKTRSDHAGDGMVLYLEGLTMAAHDAPPEAIEETFRSAVRAAPADFFPARETLVSYLLSREKFPEAGEIVAQQASADVQSAKAWQLRVQVEAAQQRYLEALQIAQEARTRFPDNTDIRMELVSVYRLRGQDAEADAELQSLIHDKPREEPAYRMLINSLFNRARRGDPQATTAAITSVTNSLLAEIPDSRFARVTAAILRARAGRYEEAQNILGAVLAVDPDNTDALVTLAEIRQASNNGGQGAELLEASIKRKPQVEVVRALVSLYREQDRKADALALARRFAMENADTETYASLYASELIAQGDLHGAREYLVEAIKRFPRSETMAIGLARLWVQSDDPDQDADRAIMVMRDFVKANGETTDRLYLLSHFYSVAGNDDASVAALQRVLSIMPDHVGANNDLGYFWANGGVHLDQAEQMIRKALENKPEDPAFVDSLGWLYYKQGRFSDALRELEKAVAMPGGAEPEVIRHLADTLYRLNRTPEAIEKWSQAEQRLAIPESLTSFEREQRDYLTKVIAAAKDGKDVPVSPIAVPNPAKAVSSGATTAPQ